MRGTVARRIRREAEKQTQGQHVSVTKKLYRQLKKRYKKGV